MKKFVEVCLKQSVINNLVFIVLIIIGVYSLLVMPVERYPNIHMGDMFITTYLHGAAPSDVENLITVKYEKEIRKHEDVDFVKSQSSRNRSLIKIHFKDGINHSVAVEEIKLALQGVRKEIPAEAETPLYAEATANDWLPVVQLNVFGKHDMNAISLIAKEMKVLLERTPGVKRVELVGEFNQEYHIKISPKLLRKYGVTFQSIVDAIQKTNVNIPMGSLKVIGKEIFLKADEKFDSNTDVLNVIVRRDGDGSFVRISDLVSETGMNYQKPNTITSANGNICVGIKVLKSETGNALEIKADAQKIVDEFRDKNKGLADFDIIVTHDNTVRITESLGILGASLTLGIVMVFILMTYFLGFRNSLLATVGIPFSCLFTLIFLKLTGGSINEISLFSFILVSGIIVDDAIIVIENIYRHMEEGESVYDAVINGTSEVIKPVFCATLTTISAFLPMLMMTGSTGEFFSIIPKSVAFALTASLIEALVMLPLHFYDFTPKDKKISHKHKKSKVIAFIEPIYLKMLNFCLNYKVVAIVILFSLSSFCVYSLVSSIQGSSKLIKVKLFPDTYLQYYVIIEGPIDSPLSRTNEYLQQASEIIKQGGKGEYDAISGDAGLYINEDYQIIFGYHYGMLTVIMPLQQNQKFDDYPVNDPKKLLSKVRARLIENMPSDVNISVRAEYEGPPKGKPISIRVFGQNEESVNKLATKIRDYMINNKDFSAMLNIKDDRGTTRNVASLRTKPIRAKEYGLSSVDILGVAAGLIDGSLVGKYRGPRDDVDIKVMINEKELSKPEDILNIPIVEDANSPILISDVAEFEYVPELSVLNRFDELRSIEITADLDEEKAESASVYINQVKKYYETIKKDFVGAQVSFEGEFAATAKSYRSLGFAFIISFICVYLILAWQFQSYAQPVVISSAIIFATVGVIIGLLITRQLFTLNNFIAVIGLSGVVVNDSLVLVDFINTSRMKGMSLREAIINGCSQRMRPILLTTITTSLGLLPMAIGFPSYSEAWGGMANSFVSGLCFATFLTILIIPVLYEIIEGIKIKIYKKDIYHQDKMKKKIIKKIIRRKRKPEEPTEMM